MKYIGEILNLTNVDITKYLFSNLINVKNLDFTKTKITPIFRIDKDKLDFILDKINASYSGYNLAIKIEKNNTNYLLIKLLNRTLYIKCLKHITT